MHSKSSCAAQTAKLWKFKLIHLYTLDQDVQTSKEHQEQQESIRLTNIRIIMV